MDTQANFTDVGVLRQRARDNIEQGAITASYLGNREQSIQILNSALATELIDCLRLKLHASLVQGLAAPELSATFNGHAMQHVDHVDLIARRIVQLEGDPDFSPDTLLSRSATEFIKAQKIGSMIQENLVAARIGLDLYRDMTRYFGNNDSTTRRLFEDLLESREKQATDLASLLERHNRIPLGTGIDTGIRP